MIIGLLGQKSVGKDTVADYIHTKYDFTEKKIAGPLKDSIGKLFGFNEDQLNGDLKEEIDSYWKITPRMVLQFFGTEIMQEKINDILPVERKFFVKCFDRWYSSQNTQSNIVISDIRFQHEVDYIKENNGIVIKINRDTIKDNFSTHISELGIDSIASSDIDYIINNNGTIEDLHENINDIMEKLNFVIKL